MIGIASFGSINSWKTRDKKLCQVAYANRWIVRDTDYSDKDIFASAVSSQTLVYPLATPTTYQLTPQEVTSLLGGNTVWADSGNVEVTYKADIQKYIDKKISAVLNA